MKKNVESVTVRGILTTSAEAPAGTARKKATETVIVPTRKVKEEEHQAETEGDKNPPPDKETSLNKEETPLTLRNTKAESPEIIGLRQMTLMIREQLILKTRQIP